MHRGDTGAILRATTSGADDLGVFIFFVVQICTVVFLQRITTPGIGIDIAALIMPVGIVILALTTDLFLSPMSLTLYTVLAIAVLISQALVGEPSSMASVSLFLLSYLPFVLRLPVHRLSYSRCLLFFQNVMLLVCAIVVVQDAWQFTIGWKSFPDMDRLLPKGLITQGFVYLQPLVYGSSFIKPSAFFFKEVSFVSQYLALAFIIELVIFRRYWRIFAYLGCIFATFAGTGLFLIAIVSPILIARLPSRTLAVLSGVVLTVCVIAVMSGWYEQVSYRLMEYQNTDSSTYGRFIFPFLAIDDQIPTMSLFSGVGAGNIPTDQLFVFIPIVKLMLEYGPTVTVAFYAMFIHALFRGTPNFRLAAALFVLYNLMGGYFQSPIIINTVLLLGTLLRPGDLESDVVSEQPDLAPSKLQLAASIPTGGFETNRASAMKPSVAAR